MADRGPDDSAPDGLKHLLEPNTSETSPTPQQPSAPPSSKTSEADSGVRPETSRDGLPMPPSPLALALVLAPPSTDPSSAPLVTDETITLAGTDEMKQAMSEGNTEATPSTRRVPFEAPSPMPGEELRRLEALGLIARGGMGEVHRVKDHWLKRVLAMKVLHTVFSSEAEMRTRFVEEAQVTAQLAHPCIPPIHDFGELEDGRPFFTMKEVHGRTLAEIIRERRNGVKATLEAWSPQRLIGVFHRVCEAIAYAHARGVIHCDIKPDNIMVGSYGEVLVMDWGVAQLVDQSGTPEGVEAVEPVDIVGGRLAYRFIAGTIGYMAPEHALGELEKLGPPADVFALGVTLYELLRGRRPYRGSRFEQATLAANGNPPPLKDGLGSDDGLWGIICKALASEPDQRYPNAGELAKEVARWREGALRREKAAAVAEEARKMLPEADSQRKRAGAMRVEADARLALLRDSDMVELDTKAIAWELQDQALELERDADLVTVRGAQLLQAALVYAPDLEEAKVLLARIHYERHWQAERRREWGEAAQHEILLNAHDVGEYEDYLAAVAELTIVTDVPCQVQLHRFVRRQRQLVPEYVDSLGEAPITNRLLPIGSYLLRLVAADRPSVDYPVVLRRRHGWDGRRPGEDHPTTIMLPKADSLRGGQTYVPAGWFEAGGDESAARAGPLGRVWVDGFVIQTTPITFRDLASFLAAKAGKAWRNGIFRDGLEVWRPDWPGVGISWEAAQAFAQWRVERTGLPWRLPTELEWEKAARGVDGRFFPWGDFADEVFCHARQAGGETGSPVGVDTRPQDASPYGLLGAGGNVRDWCEGTFGITSELRVARGGSWRQPLEAARVASRTALRGEVGYPDVSVRLVRSI